MRYYLYRYPTDMRKSFDSLCGIISGQIGGNPMSGDVYIFINRRRNKIKLLHWEQGGLVLYYKRLERGTIEFPDMETSKNHQPIQWATLMMMVEGIGLSNIQHRKRYSYQQA